MGGSDKKASLWTKEGVRLTTIAERDDWVWRSRMLKAAPSWPRHGVPPWLPPTPSFGPGPLHALGRRAPAPLRAQ